VSMAPLYPVAAPRITLRLPAGRRDHDERIRIFV
jgi:hypothetical protein